MGIPIRIGEGGLEKEEKLFYNEFGTVHLDTLGPRLSPSWQKRDFGVPFKVLGLPTYTTVHCRSGGGISEIYTTILYRCIRDMLDAKILDAALD